MKLIVRADDYGLTDGVTLGILKGFKMGIITCAGLMTNMPSSKWAAEQIKMNPQYSFGQDINLVAGSPVSNHRLIPHLVDEVNRFRKSSYYNAQVKLGVDPLPYDEVIVEVENQVKKFIELTGKLPHYLNGHAFRTPNFSRALANVADKYQIINMDKVRNSDSLGTFKDRLYNPPFTTENQLLINSEKFVIDHFHELLNHNIAFFNCHPGFVDEELIKYSSLNIGRVKDLTMVTSRKIRNLIIDNNVELISVKQYVEENIT